MDATKATLERILGSGDYETIEGVPVFTEHDEPVSVKDAQRYPLFVVKGKDGGLVRRFDRKALEYLAKRGSEREKKTGDLGLFGPGHTIPDQWKDGILIRKIPETDQPPVWGAFGNWRVGRFGPDAEGGEAGESGELGLLVDLYARPQYAAEVGEFPRRSSELWLADGTIDWLALMRRTPRLDMGLVMNRRPGTPHRQWITTSVVSLRRGKRQGLCMRYSMEDYDMAGMAGTAPADPTGVPPDANEPSPDEAKQYDRMWKHFMKQPMMQYMQDCFSKASAEPPAGADAPGGDAPAGGMDAPGGDAPAGDKKPDQFARNPDLAHEARLASRRLATPVPTGNDADLRNEVRLMNSRLATAEKESRIVRYEKGLRDLRSGSKAVVFDVAEELRYVEDMSPEMYARHLDRLQRLCARDPATMPAIPTLRGDDGSEGDQDAITEQHGRIAQQYMRQHECDWDEAVEKTRGKSTARAVTR